MNEGETNGHPPAMNKAKKMDNEVSEREREREREEEHFGDWS